MNFFNHRGTDYTEDHGDLFYLVLLLVFSDLVVSLLLLKRKKLN